MLVAKTLTYPEKVTPHNIDKMRQLVLAGADVWPGAFYVIAENENGTFKTDLRFGKRETVAQNLKMRVVCGGEALVWCCVKSCCMLCGVYCVLVLLCV